jgi:hypothetical protein
MKLEYDNHLLAATDLSGGLSKANRYNEGKTTNGWGFIYFEMPAYYFNSATEVVVGFWHGPIPDPPQIVDSTFCVDNVVFGEIIK